MKPPRETRALRLAANAAGFAVVAFGALFLFSAQVQSIRAQSPWSNDPYDLVTSYASIIVPIIAVLIWFRSVRYRGPQQVPAEGFEQIFRGAGLALGILLAVVIADSASLAAGARHAAWGGWTPAISALLAVLAVATVTAIVLTVRAWVLYRRGIRGGPRERRRAARPDAFEDVSAVLSDFGTHAERVWPFAGRLISKMGSLVERLARGRFGPRRHPLAFLFAMAVAFGAGLSATHALREGPWVSLEAAAIFALLGALGIFVPLAIFGRWLDIARKQTPAH